MNPLETNSNERPLLTFAIVAYNQEAYIREAIEAAFAQTYSPLQIILSDDCSPDRTFEIMQEMTAGYVGPHIVCLNRNPTNRHIGGHVNAVMSLAKGELVVIAAGDDISAPNRVQRNFDAWDAAGRPEYCSILSGIEHFGEGVPTRYAPARTAQSGAYSPYLFDDTHVYNGAGHTWTASTFRLFGNLPEGLVNEDTALIVRNTVAGCLLTIDEPLVVHRLHGENTGAAGWADELRADSVRRYYLGFLRNREKVVRSFHADFETAKRQDLPNLQRFGAERLKVAMEKLRKEERLCAEGQTLIRGSALERALLLAKCVPGKTATARFLRKSWLRVLSPTLYVRLRAWVRRLRGQRNQRRA